MDVSNIIRKVPNFNKQEKTNSIQNNPAISFGKSLKLSQLKTDMISFGNISPLQTAESKIITYVQDQIKDLMPDQPIKITTTQEHMPVAKLMAQEAYKKGAGTVVVNVIEPELDRLKAKYDGQDFKWKQLKEQVLEKQGLIKIDLGETTSPFKDAKLSAKEIAAVNEAYHVKLPQDVIKLMEKFVDPKEILEGKLHLKEGQPLRLFAERQHEPLVNKLVEYAYQKGSKVVDVIYNDGGPNNFDVSYAKYASEKSIMEVPEWIVPQFKEYIDTNTARLYLDGEDPESMKDVSSERMKLVSKGRVEMMKAIDFYRKDNSCPWCIYYAPSTKSSIIAYPEVKKGQVATKDEEIEALRLAAKDAVKINRVGTADAHYAKLNQVAQRMNQMKFDEVHFFRKDKKTGKVLTDLYIGMGGKSIFRSAEEKTIPNDKSVTPQPYIANCPTEEVFSSPHNKNVRGFVTATMPLSLNGKIVEDIYVEFDNDGKIITEKINASKNKDVFADHVKDNEGADRLGEIALVAGSPIFDTGRLFYSTLLDENAACHIAIGEGFAECIEGVHDVDPSKMEEYLKENNCNKSTTHIDFMIGGPDVLVEGIKHMPDGTVKKTTIIEDNAFKI
ncbi:MAG: aminopeptidase [Cyanobacteriota bacterium]